MNDNCPCPNLTCPNHGDCAKCTISHLRKGYLNYCAFHTLLPAVREVIAESPDSAASKKLNALVQLQLDVYEKLKAQHGISQEEMDQRLARLAEFGPA